MPVKRLSCSAAFYAPLHQSTYSVASPAHPCGTVIICLIYFRPNVSVTVVLCLSSARTRLFLKRGFVFSVFLSSCKGFGHGMINKLNHQIVVFLSVLYDSYILTAMLAYGVLSNPPYYICIMCCCCVYLCVCVICSIICYKYTVKLNITLTL